MWALSFVKAPSTLQTRQQRPFRSRQIAAHARGKNNDEDLFELLGVSRNATGVELFLDRCTVIPRALLLRVV
jgi:hypothetical protein